MLQNNLLQTIVNLVIYEDLKSTLDENRLKTKLIASLDDLMALLGIPGSLTLNISYDSFQTSDHIMQLSVNGHLCRYSLDLLEYARSYILTAALQPNVKLQTIIDWLMSDKDACESFLALCCIEIIKLQPDYLMSPDHAAYFYPARWTNDNAALAPSTFQVILQQVLALRIGLKGLPDALEGVEARDEDVLRELLINKLKSPTIELHFSPTHLKQFTAASPEKSQESFPFLRNEMFTELGVSYPRFTFVANENLSDQCFAFKLNSLMTMPQVGLKADECLVNSATLNYMGIQPRPTIIPASFLPGSLIDIKDQAMAEAAGLTTWDQNGFFIMSLAANLRRFGACFVTRESVENLMKGLEKAFPTTVDCVRDFIDISLITGLLRGLIAEEISIRNLLFIFEQLLYLDIRVSDNLLPTIRHALRGYIGHKYARNTTTIVTYLLDPKIESILSQRLTDKDAVELAAVTTEDNAILKAVKEEMSYLPPSATLPVILTTKSARPHMKKLLQHEIPRLHVISYDDLPIHLNIQPVARIAYSLSTLEQS